MGHRAVYFPPSQTRPNHHIVVPLNCTQTQSIITLETIDLHHPKTLKTSLILIFNKKKIKKMIKFISMRNFQ